MEHVSNEFFSKNLSFVRFPAIDSENLRDGNYDLELGKIHPNTTCNIRDGFNSDGHVSAGVKCCRLTHIQTYYYMIDTVARGNVDLPVLVVEDDVVVSKGIRRFVEDSASLLPDDWEVFVLGYKNDYCNTQIADNLCRAKLFLDTTAYIVRNATVARRLVEITDKGCTSEAIDMMWVPLMDFPKDRAGMNFYLIRPVPVIQQSHHFLSDLQRVNETTYNPEDTNLLITDELAGSFNSTFNGRL